MGDDLLIDLVYDFGRSALAARLAFIDAELDRAWELTDPKRRHHLVVIEHQPKLVAHPDRLRVNELALREVIPPAVACSWPLPPLHARQVEPVPVGSFL